MNDEERREFDASFKGSTDGTKMREDMLVYLARQRNRPGMDKLKQIVSGASDSELQGLQGLKGLKPMKPRFLGPLPDCIKRENFASPQVHGWRRLLRFFGLG
ncbi:MAG: hypothetical protein AAB389_01635 [Patescibacteria group bacterium]